MKYKSKYGLNSGNTFHFGSRLRLMQGSSARLENILLKTVECEKGHNLPFDVKARSAADVAERKPLETERRARLEKLMTSTVPDGGLPITSCVSNHQLTVSLNKHKRWLLPEVITDCISELRSREQLYLKDCDASARSAGRRRNVDVKVREDKSRRRPSRDKAFPVEYGDSSERPGVNIRVSLKHRLITSRPQESFVPRHPDQPCGSRRADCVHYDDSAAVPSKRRNVKSTASYAWHLRRAMRPLKEADDVMAGPSESSDGTAAHVAARWMRRTHTRGVQRMKSGKCKRSKPSRRWRWMWQIDDQERNPIDITRDIPEVQYEICTARPLTAHRSQNDISHRIRFPWHYRYVYPKKSLKKSGGRLRRYKAVFAQPTTSRDLYNYVNRSFENDESFDDTLYDISSDYDEVEKFDRLSCPLLWDSLLEAGRSKQRTKSDRKKVKNVTAAAAVATKNSNRATSRTVRRRGKGEAIYIGSYDDSKKTEIASATPLDLNSELGSPVPIPIASNEHDVDDDENEYVIVETVADRLTGSINKEKAEKAFSCSVRRHSTESFSLSARYRDRFMESRTIPRRFVLDLTERGGSNDLEINNQTRLYLVVEEVHVVDERRCGQSAPIDVDAFSQLRCHLVGDDVNDDVRALLKNRFHDAKLDNFDDIIQTAVSSVEANGRDDCMLTAPVSSFQSASTIPRFRFISRICQWSVKSCGRHHAFNAFCSFNPRKTIGSNAEKQRWTLPESCGVCYRALLPDQDGCMNGLALPECCHWFCEGCWQRHLANAISQNRLKLLCPSYQCTAEIDRIALISLLPLSLVDQYWTYSSKASIDSNPERCRWCVNPRCQFLLHQRSERASIDQSMVASCLCGCTACFRCGEAPHWPSTCEQTDIYNRMKLQRGDVARKQPPKAFYVSVKPCPSCHYPIEIHGGCSYGTYMTCIRCSNLFCCVCLTKYSSHDIKRCFDSGVQAISIDRSDEVRRSLRFYQSAIAQRWKRVACHDNRKILHKLTNKCLRLQRVVEVANVSYDDWVDVTGIQQSDLPSPACAGADRNIFSILAAAASFYLDVRFTLEYCYVLKITSTGKERRKNQHQLQILQFIADNVEQALFCSHGRRSEARLLSCLLARIQRGYHCMESLARSLDGCNDRRCPFPR